MPNTAAEQTKKDSSPAVAAPIASNSSAPLTAAMLKALRRAADRPRGNICPVAGGARANAEHMLLLGLDRRGLIAWDNPEPAYGYSGSSAPRINDAGRAALAKSES